MTIETEADAISRIEELNSQSIIDRETAESMADALGFDLEDSDYKPVSHMDRFQPNNDGPAIGVGDLCAIAVERGTDLEAERPTSLGHGRTARERYESNLPKLKEAHDLG